MKKLLYTLSAAAVLGLSSCDNGFEEMNVDPNNPTSVPVENLLTQGQFALADRTWGTAMNAEWGMLLVQYWGQNQYASESRYQHDKAYFTGSWQSYYANSLKDLTEVERILGETEAVTPQLEAEKKNMLAIVKILKVHVFQIVTDTWGSVPYSQALNPAEYPSPAYDTQEDIYLDLISKLDEALSELDNTNAAFNQGDIIYDNDIDSWKKFANALKARVAIRMIDANGSASTFLQQALTAADKFESNADNATLVFDNQIQLANPLWVNVTQDNRDDYSVTEFFVEHMKTMNDPRLGLYAAMNADDEYVGLPFGLTDAESLEASKDGKTSRPSGATKDEQDLPGIRAKQQPAILMSYAELKFIEAEAIQRGVIGGSAETVFKEAIAASMDAWGVEEADKDAYLATVTYDAANWKKSIGEAKYVALYGQGVEAWSEWRRLDYPQLTVPAAAITIGNTAIPTRGYYPNDEEGLNAENVPANNYTDKVWWDVN
ncbi:MULTISPECIES: SusD/RagB family nutrient-binding outer membrane lipoprotein [Flammeovirga]|uniref:SusD/RagB family nutrient-binding outer membrane lipoprotein n=1 Tax=Flammeovirga agarivorans TaxID=2726742 RepID=A0A7X8XYY8_9BACT|nr:MULTISPECIES: SusD/RagB family nutrient-binding outer membrane lipoprotein [Flammeovirga]NLR94669.1 SusD/RagB family nutrient-binding outer membrane lipoprotein [Flammeovirga agarivorans]